MNGLHTVYVPSRWSDQLVLNFKINVQVDIFSQLMWIHFEYQVICMCDVSVIFTFGDKLSCLYFVSAKTCCRCWFTSCGTLLWVIENSLLLLPRRLGGYVSSGIHLLLFGFLLNLVERWCIGQERIHYILVCVLIK